MNIKIKDKETSMYIEVKKLDENGISKQIAKKLWDTDTVLSKEVEKIEKIEFETYDEYLKVVEDDQELYFFNNNILIGQNQDNELEIKVDNRENCLVNVTKLDYDDNQGGVKTYYFNADISSIASYFDKHGSYFVESALREQVSDKPRSYECKKFNEIMEKEAESFYIYNQGITLVTNNAVKVRGSNPNIYLELPYIVEGIELIKYYLHRNKNETIEIPIRIMSIKNIKDKQVENLKNISQKLLVSPSVETEVSLRTKLNYYDLINEELGLNIKEKDGTLAQYLKFYTYVIMQKPGIEKLKMKEIQNNCFEDTSKDEVSLNELISNNKIFTEPSKKIECNLFENGVMTSLELHKFLSREVFKQYLKMEKKFNESAVNLAQKNSFLSLLYYIYILKYGFEKPSNEEIENELFPFVLKYIENVIREDTFTLLEKLENLEEREFILNNVTQSFSNEYLEKQSLKQKAQVLSVELDNFIENIMVSQYQYFLFNKFKEYVITRKAEAYLEYTDDLFSNYIHEFMESDYYDLLNSQIVYEYIKGKYLENMEAFDYLFELNSETNNLTISKLLKATELSKYGKTSKIYEFIIEDKSGHVTDYEKNILIDRDFFEVAEISDLKINAWIKALELCRSFDKADEIWMIGEKLLNTFSKDNLKKLANVICVNDQLYRRSGARSMFNQFNEKVKNEFNEDEIKTIQKQNFAMETLELNVPK